MANADELLLNDEPFPKTEVWKTLDVFVSEKTLGVGARRVKKDSVPVRIPLMLRLDPSRLHGVSKLAYLASANSDFYLFYLPFDIDSSDVDYREVKLLVSLDHPEARSWDLYPKDINTEQDVEKKETFGLSADLKFALGASAEFGAAFHYKNLRPIISAYGEGSNVFRWEYRSQPSQSIVPGTRSVYAVLQVPSGLRYLAGKIEYEAILEDKFWKLLKDPASIEYEPFKWRLPAMSSNPTIRLSDFTQAGVD